MPETLFPYPMPVPQLHLGDCLDVLPTLPENSIDSMVTDPPAGISMMGKDWDCFRRRNNQNDVERKSVFGRTSRTSPHFYGESDRGRFIEFMTAAMTECLRVLKPGAHALIWTLPRTSHWTAMAVEDAGFELRDVISHLFATGYPKGIDVGKAIDKEAGVEREVVGTKIGMPGYSLEEDKGRNTYSSGGRDSEIECAITAPATDEAKKWDGYNTGLKPSREDWLLVRKPLIGTVAQNVLSHGTGALNIDACRIHTEGSESRRYVAKHLKSGAELQRTGGTWRTDDKEYVGCTKPGRWPANTVFDEGAAEMLDQQSGVRKSGMMIAGTQRSQGGGYMGGFPGCATEHDTFGDSGGASRFFFVAKPSPAERNMGLGGEKNPHPTVKAISLCDYLIRLITPSGGKVLDCFMGSGSVGIAALRGGWEYIGIEREPVYMEVAKKRLAAA